MDKVIVAFDCDGTLVTTDSAETKKIVANERVRTLLIAMASMKNTRIVVWSGGGEAWARQVARSIGIEKYVYKYYSKNYIDTVDGKHIFEPPIEPDIAIDDIQACELGKINLIVKEK